ncbi:MAG: hypothetical protein GX556_06385 [Fibrobacter sp.]|nr:hypothetical protein [Fibrobacter sp.]
MISLRSVFLLFAVLTGTTAQVWAAKGGDVVKDVNLDQYAGTWYEIARLPNKHQKGLVEVTSTLKRTKDGYVMINSGFKGSRGGKKTTVKGNVMVKNKRDAGAMKVRAFIFSIDYRIIDLDKTNYSYALVTTDSEKFLWILSKSPVMEQQVYDRLVESARQKGFDVARLERVSQESNSALVGR